MHKKKRNRNRNSLLQAHRNGLNAEKLTQK